MKILKLEIEGFRSLKKIDWEPGALNVIIGPNGTGKSNLLRFLELISVAAQGKLGKYIQSIGGMEPIVWDGTAQSIAFTLKSSPVNGDLGPEQYSLNLARLGTGSSYRIDYEQLASYANKLLERTTNSAVVYNEDQHGFTIPAEFVSEEETLLSVATGPFTYNHFIPPFQRELAAICVYHDFHTNRDAAIRQPTIARLEKRVAPDGQNLISVLHTLYTEDRDFKKGINLAMQAAFGDDFEELVFPPAADQRIQLRIRWKSLRREQSAADLSDGTLRFLFLLTVLTSPSSAPVIAIDEPETGLHPSMLPIVAEYAVEASARSQIILTTHSPQFLDAFTDTNAVTTIAQWEDGETKLKKLKGEELGYWLKEYSLGSLFKSGELEDME
ncbi:MAG: AAA family ATPase [Proteobacteria bacterium]|nr:AAA family ATPase [Pseudomonadota bacterium]